VEIAKTGGGSVSFSNAARVDGNLALTTGTMTGAGTLTVVGNASLSSATIASITGLSVGGTLSSLATFTVGTVTFTGGGPQIIPAGLAYQNVVVTGSANFTSGVNSLSGSLTVTGLLDLNGQTVNVAGNFAVSGGGGQFKMQAAASILNVTGNVTINSNAGNGFLTDGTLRIGGNYAQVAGGNGNFDASASHVTEFNGAAGQSISFATPGTAAGTSSHFANLKVANSNASGITFISNTFVNGQFTTADTTTNRFLFGTGKTLTTNGWSAGGEPVGSTTLTIDNMLIVIETGAAMGAFSAIHWQNYASDAVRLHVRRAPAESFFWQDWSFAGTAPSAPGKYVHLEQVSGGTPLSLTVTVVNPVTCVSFLAETIYSGGANPVGCL
jgi:hypothetical protein